MELHRPPDRVTSDARRLKVEVDSSIRISAAEPVSRVHLRWDGTMSGRVLGDAWERSYGDLEWRGIVPERPLPWYFLLHDGRRTFGAGVKTRPGAFCFWRVDPNGVSLWLDLRCGGRGVELGHRTLEAASIVTAEGDSAYDTARALCRKMCPNPRLPSGPVHGGNSWYFTYGKGLTGDLILEGSRRLAQMGRGLYMVVDAGWQPRRECNGAPWDRGNEHFPDMGELARKMREIGVRPAIWIRPLMGEHGVLDASRSLDIVARDIRRLREWGYELIKHDFTAYDMFGRWGFDMGAEMAREGWAFADRTLTGAEITLKLYECIREAAGDAVVIGCNTFGHLGAGLFELQRIGDDNSGLEWERTRKMGINTLAFRGPQHGTFFAADADCVGITDRVPWDMNRQWMELLASSGTPLFVSSAEGHETEIRKAFETALQPHRAEPLDWMETTCPARWSVDGEVRSFDWFGKEGTRCVEVK